MRAPYGLRSWLLAGTALLVACAVSATAWLSVQGATDSIAREQRLAHGEQARIYDRLVGYAATHGDWDSVKPELAALERRTGLRIVLTPIGADRIESSPPPAGRTSTTVASAVVDPLAVDDSFAVTDAPQGIDARVTGPLSLPASEREHLRGLAEDVRRCLDKKGAAAEIVETASGRVHLRTDG